MYSLFLSTSFDPYGGRTSWLKHVWACGSMWVWPFQHEILNTISPMPPTGILSLPVVKSRKSFCWPTGISLITSQNHLCERETGEKGEGKGGVLFPNCFRFYSCILLNVVLFLLLYFTDCRFHSLLLQSFPTVVFLVVLFLLFVLLYCC